jgi:hypothetical protein
VLPALSEPPLQLAILVALGKRKKDHELGLLVVSWTQYTLVTLIQDGDRGVVRIGSIFAFSTVDDCQREKANTQGY